MSMQAIASELNERYGIDTTWNREMDKDNDT
jgi:hypothetical protein